jgi:Flp pilus assembly protein TadG
MALLMLPLLWLTFGAIDFGWYFYLQHNLEGAARNGVRRAILSSSSNADAQASVDKIMNASGFKSGAYTVTFEPSDISSAAQGTEVKVTVSMAYAPMGIPPARVPNKTVTGVAIMLKEW